MPVLRVSRFRDFEVSRFRGFDCSRGSRVRTSQSISSTNVVMLRGASVIDELAVPTGARLSAEMSEVRYSFQLLLLPSTLMFIGSRLSE